MSQVSANFEFFEGEHKDIVIQCTQKMKLSEVIDSFKNKVKSELELKDYLFYHKKKEINLEKNPELTVADFKKTIINISVRKRSKIIKCPECVDNTCFLEIKDYGLHFYGCPYNHDVIKTFSQYKDSQKLKYDEIFCDKNRETRDEGIEIYKCLTCSSKIGTPYYICDNCLNSNNNTDERQHNLIKYDEKHYICLDNKEFTSYCETCKKDLCKVCENQHKNHKIILYDNIKPAIKDRQKELEDIKNKIGDLKYSISQLVKTIENAYEVLENYYIICKDILDKYISYNQTKRNYHIIQNINFLEKSNKEVIGHLDILLQKDNPKVSLINKCGLLIDIFDKERKNYDKKISNVKEVLQKENNNNNKQNLNQNKKNGRSLNNKSNGN